MTAADHANTARKMLTCSHYGDVEWHKKPCEECDRLEIVSAALDALEAQAEELADRHGWDAANQERQRAEAAEAERDEWKRQFHSAVMDRQAAEAQRGRLADALEQMGCLNEHYCHLSPLFVDLGDDDGNDHTPEQLAEMFPACRRCAALAQTENTP